MRTPRSCSTSGRASAGRASVRARRFAELVAEHRQHDHSVQAYGDILRRDARLSRRSGARCQHRNSKRLKATVASPPALPSRYDHALSSSAALPQRRAPRGFEARPAAYSQRPPPAASGGTVPMLASGLTDRGTLPGCERPVSTRVTPRQWSRQEPPAVECAAVARKRGVGSACDVEIGSPLSSTVVRAAPSISPKVANAIVQAANGMNTIDHSPRPAPALVLPPAQRGPRRAAATVHPQP
jgi:hypothetical protein